MWEIRRKGGFTTAETLAAAVVASVVSMMFIFGISAVCNLVYAAQTKLSADALAETEAEYIKNEIRFAKDPDEVMTALSGHTAYLNGLTAEKLTFEKTVDGVVVFSFCISEYKYIYRAAPLNDRYAPDP